MFSNLSIWNKRLRQPTQPQNTSTATSEHKVVAKVVDAGKEYKVGDTTIVALKANLKASVWVTTRYVPIFEYL